MLARRVSFASTNAPKTFYGCLLSLRHGERFSPHGKIHDGQLTNQTVVATIHCGGPRFPLPILSPLPGNSVDHGSVTPFAAWLSRTA